MLKKIFVYMFFTLLIPLILTGQETITVKNQLIFNNQPYTLEKKIHSALNDTLSIDTFKYYLSNFAIDYEDGTTTIEKNSYHLVDFEKPETLNFLLKKDSNKEIKSLRFCVGIDSLTNVSGALADDLDPTNGMYWAWQSGYINMKIEGKNINCNTRNHKFQFHIGGYLYPYYALREIKVYTKNLDNKDNVIHLNFDVAKLFETINLKDTHTIMIPCKEAMHFSDLLQQIITLE